MSTQPDTLHDRITALADEWEREATRWRNPANPTHRRTSRSDPRRDGRPDLADVYDFQASALRAVLAETATAQPETDAVEDVDRRLLWLDRAAPTPWAVRVVADGLPSNGPGGHEVADANGLALVQTDYDEHGYHLAHLIAQAPDLYRARAALAAAQPVEPEANEQAAHDRITALVDLHDRLVREDPVEPEADAVERAARGWHEAAEREAQDEGGAGMGPWESIDTDSRARALRYMRAALAAAGGGCACPWHEDGDESGGYGVYEQAHTSDCAAAAQPVEPEPRVCDGCTGEYPDGDPGVIHKHYGEHCACGWFGPSWQAHRPTCPARPVEPEPDEREASRYCVATQGCTLAPDHYGTCCICGPGSATCKASCPSSSRSRPEAPHTVTSAAVVSAKTSAVRIADAPSLAWCIAFLAALGVTVADTPTQAGDDA